MINKIKRRLQNLRTIIGNIRKVRSTPEISSPRREKLPIDRPFIQRTQQHRAPTSQEQNKPKRGDGYELG